MTAVLIIAAAMLVVWVYLRHQLQLPGGVEGFELDINRQPWSFFQFFDRYCSLCKWVGWLNFFALAGAVISHNKTAAWLLVAALIDNIAFQALVMFWYERYEHTRYTTNGAIMRFSYTPNKYAFTLTMSIALPIYLVIGLALTVAGY